jgi:hypothetical protein
VNSAAIGSGRRPPGDSGANDIAPDPSRRTPATLTCVPPAHVHVARRLMSSVAAWPWRKPSTSGPLVRRRTSDGSGSAAYGFMTAFA